MDFNDTPEEAEFRAEARAFLEQHLEPKGAQPLRQRVSGEELMKRAKTWQAEKAKAGYAKITWPKEMGGRGGTPMQQVIWGQEEGRFDSPGASSRSPRVAVNAATVAMATPAISMGFLLIGYALFLQNLHPRPVVVNVEHPHILPKT